MTLHLLKAQLDLPSLLNVLKGFGPQDACLLRDDATFLLLKSDALCALEPVMENEQLYVLQEDAEARSIPALEEGINYIDYTQFVALTLEYSNTISW